jgi:hypothetical protein
MDLCLMFGPIVDDYWVISRAAAFARWIASVSARWCSAVSGSPEGLWMKPGAWARLHKQA